MSPRFLPHLALSIALAGASSAGAQSSSPSPTPAPPAATKRPAPILSPETREDGSIAFRLRAPNAKSVVLRGQWTKTQMPMAQEADGTWSVTLPSVEAGIWEYSFIVEGLTMIDPANPLLKPMREPRASILHVPGNPPKIWDFQDVPHGTVHQHDYLSKPLARLREIFVYTPPGYESDRASEYPLLVLQHGSGDNQQTWVALGKAHWILDNLIAQRKAKPMIVLMMDGHPLGQVQREAPGDRRAMSLEAFEREMFEDALPLVESRYRVSKKREQRAITGLSMGGWQSLSIGFKHLDRFAYIGSFSGGMSDDALLKPLLDNPAATNAQLKLLWIGIGKDDAGRARNEQFVANLKEHGVNREWVLSEGDHSWPVWRGYLAEFAPKLFR